MANSAKVRIGFQGTQRRYPTPREFLAAPTTSATLTQQPCEGRSLSSSAAPASADAAIRCRSRSVAALGDLGDIPRAAMGFMHLANNPGGRGMQPHPLPYPPPLPHSLPTPPHPDPTPTCRAADAFAAR
eukprot:6205752-Pleurochrysis_carterae.AAC.2